MADNEAEDIGGISVSIGASHAGLQGDLSAADRIFEEYRARWEKPVVLQTQARPGGAGTAAAGGVGGSEINALSAKLDRLATSLSAGGVRRAQAQAEQVTINGVRVGGLSNLQTSLQKAIGGVDVEANVAPVNQQINELRVQTEKPIELNLDVAGLQTELQGVLTTLREITAETGKLASTPTVSAAGGRGGGGRKRTTTAAAPQPEGEEGDEGGLTRQTIRYVGGPFKVAPVPLTPTEPSALTRQRQRELAAAARVRQQPSTPQLNQDELTRSNRVVNPFAYGSSTIHVPGRDDQPPVGGGGGGGGGGLPPPSGGGGRGRGGDDEQSRRAQRQRDILRSTAFDEQQATRQALTRSARVRRFEIDEQQQARQVEARRAAITGSGRTSRTLASGLGALFGGTETRQIEAQAAAQQAARQLSSAGRVIAPLDERLRQLREGFNSTTGTQQKFYANQIKNIEQSKQYQEALTGVTKAVKDDDEAQKNLAKISGAGSVVRNLVAITAAGAAFGAGLKVADLALRGVESSLGNFIDIQTGFGATSTKITSALGAQTLALHGNVDAALAGAEAQAGLSTASSDFLNTQIKLTTQIKAGAQAQEQANELFRAGAGVGNAPSGLYGGYGGLGGSALLAQQLGGGRGFTEQLQQQFGAFQGQQQGPNFLDLLNKGLSYVASPQVRGVVDTAGANQGNLLQDAVGAIGRVPGGIVDRLADLNPFGQGPVANEAQRQGAAAAAAAPPTLSNEGTAFLNDLNAAAKRGATSLGSASQATLAFTNDTAKLQQAISAAAQAGDAYGVTLAAQQHIVVELGGAVVSAGEDYKKAIEQFSVGRGIADPAQLARVNLANERQRERESAANLDTIRAQQAFERPSQIAATNRQTQFAIGTQLPAQAALAALANPNVPVGTGIARQDQGKVVGQLKAAQSEQQQLNAYYAQGQDIIENTYRPAILQNFGQAAVQQFDAALNAVKATGQAIASIQAGISNEQAQYQVAQYNFQLLIAKRNLSDIGGLVGKNLGAGESYLGVLERQNLQLSRQGQLLQFALSQRQINFQTALAGFQAPGVTPEERQARIAEAKIEAEYAQKQLNIQKQQFQNQVKIVDIGNLRQGADLVRQIALLTRGRQVTIDTAAAEQRLLRLQQLQQQNVAKVSTYLSAVDKLTNQAFADIQQLEAAAGHALESVAVSVLSQFGIFIKGLTSQLAKLAKTASYYDNPNGNLTPKTFPGYAGYAPTKGATGLIGMTAGRTEMVVGEAQGEAVAILRNPRSVSGFGGNGAGSVVVQFNGDIHTDSQASLEKVTQAVVKALGREASLKGLRGIG